MATIRTVMIGGAALVALFALAPKSAQAQTVRCPPNAPLQLVPTLFNKSPCVTIPSKVTKKAATKTSKTTKTSKVTKTVKAGPKTATKRTAGRKTTVRPVVKAATRPAAKRIVVRPTARKTAAADPTGAPAEIEQTRKAKIVARPLVPRPAAPSTAMSSPQPASDEFVPAASDNVMRGSDSVSLIARLPWWRGDPMQTIQYGGEDVESKVLAAAEAWLGGNDGSAVNRISEEAFASAPPPGAIVVADAGQANEIDLAASSANSPSAANAVPPAPNQSFLFSLIALLAGAAAAVALARYWFSRLPPTPYVSETS
jgi:hypothetical protein